MAGRRPHTEEALSEARSRERRYDELQRKTSKDTQQMNLGFDASPPSRTDAKQLVEERRKKQAQTVKPKAKTVPKTQPKQQTSKQSPNKDGSHHAQPVHSSTKTKQSGKTMARKKSSSAKAKKASKRKVETKKPMQQDKAKGSRKGKGRRNSFKIQLSLPVFIVMVLVIALLGGSLIAWKIVDSRDTGAFIREVSSAESVRITVEPGMSARTVAKLLEEKGAIVDAKVFERYLEMHGSATRIQAGTYVFDPGLTHALIAEILVSPTPQAIASQGVTVFAGFTIEDIDVRLSDMGVIEAGAFIDAVGYVVEERGLPFAEGWFLSGTYPLESNGSVSLTLARIMQDACNDALRPYLIALEELDISLADAVVIASLVQRETNNLEQMPAIAGVIYNRLRLDMPIGIDAALRYRYDAWERPLLDKELSSLDPFNVRRVKGLPPTGIGAPSISAIDAALHPASHRWLYYIHDKQGAIHFAETYADHQENIEKFLQ